MKFKGVSECRPPSALEAHVSAHRTGPSGNETRAPESLEELQRSENSDNDDGDKHQVVGMQRPKAEQLAPYGHKHHESQQRPKFLQQNASTYQS